MFEAFFAVLPVFLVIFLGSWLHDRDVLPEQTGVMLGLMVLRLSLPALILHILAGAKASDLAYPAFWIGMFGASLLVYFLGYWADRLFCRRGEGPATIVALGCSSCNAAFVGLPIVASDVKGHHDLLAPHQAGLLYPYGDASACAQQIRDLLAQPQLRQALSATARQTVTPYLLPTVLPQVMGQYQQLLDLGGIHTP